MDQEEKFVLSTFLEVNIFETDLKSRLRISPPFQGGVAGPLGLEGPVRVVDFKFYITI